MLKQAFFAVSILVASPLGAMAQDGECKAEFALVNGTGEFTALKLFWFGKHYELQADTPAQGPLDAFSASIDGKPQALHFSLGLDDLLVGMSTDEAELELSPDFLGQLSKGNTFTITANASGKAARSEFSLKGSAAAIKRLQTGCR